MSHMTHGNDDDRTFAVTMPMVPCVLAVVLILLAALCGCSKTDSYAGTSTYDNSKMKVTAYTTSCKGNQVKTSLSGDYSKTKDGYNIPFALDADANPTSSNDEDRGKGILSKEAHLPNCVNGEHDMSHPGAENGSSSSESGPWGAKSPEEEVYYICMRWEYVQSPTWSSNYRYSTNGEQCKGMTGTGNAVDGEQMTWTGDQRCLVYNEATGRYCVCAILDYGPGVANRMGGLSPEAMYYLAGDDGDANHIQMEVWWCNDNQQALGPIEGMSGTSSSASSSSSSTKKKCSDNKDDSSSISSGVDGMVQFAEKVANDDNHGYDQGARRTGEDSADVSYDCSSLVYWSIIDGMGGSQDSYGSYPFDTSSEPGILTSNGWTEHALTSVSDLQKGDILWKDGHTGIWCGDGKEVAAHHGENGKITGCIPGDGDGTEISVVDSDPTSWATSYFRYDGQKTT